MLAAVKSASDRDNTDSGRRFWIIGRAAEREGGGMKRLICLLLGHKALIKGMYRPELRWCKRCGLRLSDER